MAVVGTAYVNIRAITKKLEADVEKAFSKIKDDLEIVVTANVDQAMNKIESVVNAAEQSEPEMTVTADTTAAEESIDHAARDRAPTVTPNPITVVANRQLNWMARSRVAQIILKVNDASLAKVETTIRALSGARLLGKYFDHLSNTLKNLDKRIMAMAGWIPIITNLGSAITAGVGGAVTVLADLWEALGVFWAAPGIFAGFALGITASYLAFKDMGDVLADLGPQFTALQDMISAKFWSQAEGPIRTLVKDLMPQLQKGFADVAVATGGFFGAMANGFNKALSGGVFVGIMKNVADSTDIAKGSMGDFTDSLVTLITAGAAYLPRLATWWKDLNAQFNEFITKAAGDGSLDQWIEQGITRMKELGRSILAITSIFASIDDAATAAGGGGLTRLTENLEKFAGIMQTPGVQTGLVHIFRGADAAMTAVVGGMSQLIGGIGRIAPMIEVSLALAGEATAQFLANIGKMIGNPQFGVGMVKMFEGFKAAMVALEPAMEPLGAKFGALMEFAGMMASQFAPVITAAIISLAPVFFGLLDVLTPVVKILAEGLTTALTAAAPYAAQFGEMLSLIGGKLTELNGPMAGVAALIAAAFISIIPAIVRVVAVVSTFVKAAGGMAGIGTALSRVFGGMLGPIGLVIAALVGMYASSESFRTAVHSIIGVVAQFVGTLVSGLLPPIMALAADVFPVLVGVLAVVGNAIGGVVAAVMPLVSQLLGSLAPVLVQMASSILPMLGAGFKVIATILSVVFAAIMSIVTPIISVLIPAVQMLASVFVAAFQGIGLIASSTAQMLGGIFTALGQVLQGDFAGAFTTIQTTFSTIVANFGTFGMDIINGLINGIAAGFTGLVTAFTNFGTMIIDTFKSILGIASPSTVFTQFGGWIIEGLINGITAMIGAVAAVMTTVGTAISAAWSAVWAVISTAFSTAWNGLVAIVTTVLTAISTVITTVVTAISATWSAIWTGIQAVASAVWAGIVTVVTTYINVVSTVISAVTAGISAAWSAIWNGIKVVISAVWAGIVAAITTYINAVRTVISAVLAGVTAVWSATWNGIRAVASAVWAGIRAVITGAINGVRAVVSSVMSGITALWSAAWNGIRNVVSTIGNAIRAVASGFINAVRAVISGGMNAVAALWQSAWSRISAGFQAIVGTIKGAINNFVSAISSGVGRAVGFFTSLPGKITGALSGLAGSMGTVGRNIIQGLINGVSGMIDNAVQAVKNVGGSMLSGIQSFLGIKSPSREFIKIGRYIIDGLDKGIGDNEIKVVDRIKTLSKNLLDTADRYLDRADKLRTSAGAKASKAAIAAAKRAVSEKAELRSNSVRLKQAAAMLKMQEKYSKIYNVTTGSGKNAKTTMNGTVGVNRILQSFWSTGNVKTKAALNITLKDLEYGRNVLESRLKSAQAKLDALVKVRDDQAKQVGDRIRDEFSLGSVMDKFEGYGLRPTIKTFLSEGRSKIAKFTTFKARIASLKSKGYAGAIIWEIANMGVDDGIAAADELLKGSSADVNGLNDVYKQLDSISQGVGMTASKAMYQAGIDTAAGLVKGIEANMKLIDKAAERLADRLVSAVNKKLGIKSPSRVFMQVGNFVGEGFISGIDQMQGAIDKRMELMIPVKNPNLSLMDSNTPSLTRYNSSTPDSSKAQVIVYPSANLDERLVGQHAARELGFRVAN